VDFRIFTEPQQGATYDDEHGGHGIPCPSLGERDERLQLHVLGPAGLDHLDEPATLMET
jgi:hypothetical protein